jgi:hypothetical protein
MSHRGVSHETKELDGRKYLVCPVVMMKEGVWPGNEGPVFYSAKQLKLFCSAWNNKPIVDGHPQNEKGEFVLANSAEVLASSKIGFLLNAFYDNAKLKAEAWIDEDVCKERNPKLYDAILANTAVDVSIGLEADCVIAAGTHNGKAYDMEAVDFRPDHLAVLVSEKGACSLADGAGLLVMQAHGGETIPEDMQKEAIVRLDKMLANQITHGRLRDLIQTRLNELRKTEGSLGYCWIEDVVGNVAIVHCDNGMMEVPFKIKNDEVTLKEVAEYRKVERVVQYRLVDGTVIGNQKSTDVDHAETTDVKKTELITRLLTNGGYDESDRPMLEGFSEEKLTKLAGKIVAEPTVIVNQTKPLTGDEMVKQLPANVQQGISYAMKIVNKQVSDDTATVVELSAGAFDAEACKAMDPENLNRLAVSLRNAAGKSPAKKTTGSGDSVDDYFGMFSTDYSGMGAQFHRNDTVLTNAEGGEEAVDDEPLGVTPETFVTA